MKRFICFFSFFLFIQHSQAQSAADLSYPEIDSLLDVYQYNIQALDKGINLSLEASQKSEKEDSLCAEYLKKAASFYKEKGNNKEAIQCYKKALEIFAKTPGINSRRYATTLMLFAKFYQQKMGNFDKALPMHIQAINILEKNLGKTHPHFASSLADIAGLHCKMGNFDKALPLYIQAISIQEKTLGKQHPHFASSLSSLAMVYYMGGNYDKALSLYIQAIDIQEKTLGKQHPHFASSLIGLAIVYYIMGNYNKALPLYIQAINILEKTLGKTHPHFAASLANLASLHMKMENDDKALHIYIQAINILEKNLSKTHPDFSASLINLANLYQKMGDLEKALPLYIQAINIQEKHLGKQHPHFASSLNGLANLHQKMGNFDKALTLYIQVINIQKKNLGKAHPNVIVALSNLAPLYQKMGKFDKTWMSALQVIESCSNLHLSSAISPLWSDTILNASFLSNFHLEKTITALDLIFSLLQEDSTIHQASYKQAILTDLATALLTKLRNSLSNDKDKMRLLAQSDLWLQRSLKRLHSPEYNNKAFALIDQNKSVLLGQASKSEQAYRLGNLPDSLILIDKKSLKKQSQLQAKLLENRPEQEIDSLLNELNHVNQDIHDFLQIIKSDYPKYHKLKHLQLAVKVADVQKLLDDKTALLEYVISDSVVHIFCIDKKQVVWKKVVVDNKKLSQRIKSLHQVLSNYKMLDKNKQLSYESYTEQAHWFYQKLIAPVLADKKNIKNLILVTDGELGHLPFETFLVEQAPRGVSNYNQLHYLVTDYNISYNYSASLWKENIEAPAPKNNGQILGVAANYDIQLDSSMMEIRLPTDQWLREILEPLPNARKEVEALQEKYQGFFAFDLLASEKMVKQKAGDFAILHFATHGILDTKRPILSSLAFTEDNDSIESNFWQAHEISKMQLNANLVVLSACETGFGKFEKGNGIASLARSFMYAGAPSLIVSLWQVNDYATSEIMKNFYENLANGMKVDQALRQAKLQYMKTAVGIMAHPAFWSPFIQIGKTQPISIKTKGGGLMLWIIGGAIFLLIFVGGFAISRRNRETT